MRNLEIVIDRIIDVIPSDEEELLHELMKVQRSVRYVPPELMNMWWKRTHEILCDHVFNEYFDKDNWKDKVRRIYVGEE